MNDLLLKGLLVDKEDCEVLDVSSCIAESTRIKFVAKINRVLDDVLPVLFLSVLNSKLTKNPMILSFTSEQHNFMIGRSGDLAVTYVKDEEEKDFIVGKVIDLVNRGIKYNMTSRHCLENLVEAKKKLTLMTLYELFPKTDCEECGEDSCFNYAAKIFTGEVDHNRCAHTDVKKIEAFIIPVNLGWSIHFT